MPSPLPAEARRCKADVGVLREAASYRLFPGFTLLAREQTDVKKSQVST